MDFSFFRPGERRDGGGQAHGPGGDWAAGPACGRRENRQGLGVTSVKWWKKYYERNKDGLTVSFGVRHFPTTCFWLHGA